MLKQNISKIYLFFMFSLNIFLATLMLFDPRLFYIAGMFVLGAVIAVNILSTIVGYFVDKNKYNSFGYTFLYLIVNALLFFFLISRPVYLNFMLFVLFGLWVILNSFFRIIKGYQYKKSQVKGGSTNLIMGIVLFLYGLALILIRGKTYIPLLIFISIYLYLFAFSYLYDFLNEVFALKGSLEKKHRYARISMPATFASLVPTKFLNAINHAFSGNENNEIVQVKKNIDDEGIHPNLEIFVHSAEDNVGKMGHVDMRIEDTIYSFGNYDPDSYKLFGTMGDGVLEVVSSKKAYLDFCIEHSKKTIVGFGIEVTNDQLDDIKKEIDGIMKNAYRWYPRIAKDKKIVLMPDELDYASALYQATDASFYKFTTGPFKNFAGFATNCVMLADEVIGAFGTDVVTFEGVVTPGTYYEFLNDEFRKKSGFVITRTIYRNINNVGKKAKIVYK